MYATDTGPSHCEGCAQPDEGEEHQDSAGLLHPPQGASHCAAWSPYQSYSSSHTRHPVLSRVGSLT